MLKCYFCAMYKFIRSFTFFQLLLSVLSTQSQNLTKYVDPFIGTGGHGHTFPGACVPFGMVQASPDTRVDGSWDGCSGYHYDDERIYGFSHTHLSGTGCSDYGDIMIMPMMGKGSLNPKHYSSVFWHKEESASPGYYSVLLKEENIQCEVSTSTRVAMHRFTFKSGGEAGLVLDLNHRDKLLEGKITVLNNQTIEGYRRSEAWAKDQIIYFRMEFSIPFNEQEIFKNKNGLDSGGIFRFKFQNDDQLKVKLALSTVSESGAFKNLQAEMNHWDFEKVKSESNAAWEKELQKIEVSGGEEWEKKNFYTALYHLMVQPNVNMDVDGWYRGRDNKVHRAEGFVNYSVFSLWDTFRAAHPLYTIIDRKRSNDFIRSFLAQYEQGGRLPVWELMCNETDCMIGYHSVSVIADAYLKGIKDYDADLALAAMIKSANWNHLGIPAYKEKGFLSVDDEPESVSKTLEYAYDDWCIARMAKAMGRNDIAKDFYSRSQAYRNLFDPKTRFIRPRKNGAFLKPFDPYEVNNHFTEANAWQYTFFAPHDIHGLTKMYGGKEGLNSKLDSLFTAENKTTGRNQADITGLIGQYAHGNEPSHHIAYLYHYAGMPAKSQKMARTIMRDFYVPRPAGLIGNEDCGQMSAWYVFSAMGFYPLCPGDGKYVLGSPLFSEVKINLENGKKFIVRAENNSKENIYIQNEEINYFLKHSQISEGGELNLKMGNIPLFKNYTSTQIGLEEKEISDILLGPVFSYRSDLFRDSLTVRLDNFNSVFNNSTNSKIYYTINGSEPSTKSVLYNQPIRVTESCTIRAAALDGEVRSKTVTAVLNKFPNNYKVHLLSQYNPQYIGGGDEALIDGVRGDVNWRKGNWQGYQYQDFEVIIDLVKAKKVSEINVGFLQDTRAWIVFPKSVDIEISKDGKTFVKAGTYVNQHPANDYTTQTNDFKIYFKAQKARFVRVRATNFGKLPQWHAGYGDEAFIFVDEIKVK